MYHINKRGQAPQYVRYTQRESVYRGDVKLPLHISNMFQTNFEIFFWNKFFNKTNFDIPLVGGKTNVDIPIVGKHRHYFISKHQHEYHFVRKHKYYEIILSFSRIFSFFGNSA